MPGLSLATKAALEYLETMNTIDLASVLELPLQERLQIVEAIWDSVAFESKDLDLQPWQSTELDRRVAEFETDPTEGVPWAEVQRRVLSGA